MEYIKDKNATLIDLRNQDELDEVGFIPHAKHIPFAALPDHLDEIKSFSKPIVLFCKGGGRAGRGKEFLQSNGIEEVYNAGGYIDVKKALEGE